VFKGFVDVVRAILPERVAMAREVASPATPVAPESGTTAVAAALGPFDHGSHFPESRVIRLDADTGEIIIGGAGRPGILRLVNGSLAETVTLDAFYSNLRMGGTGTDGDILLYASAGDRNNNGAATIHLDGEAGDIRLRNGDCAEDFDLDDTTAAPPGSVLRIADDGRLHVADQPYDRRVAGIISGAGDTRPGIVLARDPLRRDRVPVALAGRVNCWVDASYGAIATGDLLTTSATPGHAMRAGDASRAFGSVIGKALKPFTHGTGLVPVLVSLQ
jgi:hypothetical protein